MRTSNLLLLPIYCILAAAPTLAQDTPPAAPAAAASSLDPLRGKAALTDDEKNTLRGWIDQRVGVVATGDGPAAATAVHDLRAEYTGPAAFKELYAGLLIEAIRPAYKKAKPPGAARLLTVVNSLADAPADAVSVLLLEALQDERAAVRQAAAVGLRNLRVKLALAGGSSVTGTLNALRDAGKRETSAAVLRAIYQAMNYPEAVPSVPEPKQNIAAVLDLLEARAAHYDAKDAKAEGADTAGLRVAGALRGQMSDEEKKRLMTAIGRMLRRAVDRYTNGDPPLITIRDQSSPALVEQRDQIEQLIEECERQLDELLAIKGGPAVSDRMRKGKPTDMRIEMNKWAEKLKPVTDADLSLTDSATRGADDEDNGG